LEERETNTTNAGVVPREIWARALPACSDTYAVDMYEYVQKHTSSVLKIKTVLLKQNNALYLPFSDLYHL
jgi:hypothetical protein